MSCREYGIAKPLEWISSHGVDSDGNAHGGIVASVDAYPGKREILKAVPAWKGA